MIVAANLVAVVIALAAVVATLVWWARVTAPRAIVVTGLATVVWALNAAWADGEVHRWQILWLPAVSVALGGFYVVARSMVERSWRPTRLLKVVLAAEPCLVIVADVAYPALFTEGSVAGEYGVVFALHTLYCVALMMATVLVAARRQADRAPRARARVGVVTVTVAGGVAVEVLQFDVGAAVMAVAIATFVVLCRLDPTSTHVPPAPERLLDDLGAVVLAFDGQQRLVEWNAPAEMLGVVLGQGLEPGLPARALLGAELGDTDRAPLSLARGGVRLTGYSHAQYDADDHAPLADSAPSGWAVVLWGAGRTSSARNEDA